MPLPYTTTTKVFDIVKNGLEFQALWVGCLFVSKDGNHDRFMMKVDNNPHAAYNAIALNNRQQLKFDSDDGVFMIIESEDQFDHSEYSYSQLKAIVTQDPDCLTFNRGIN